MSHVISLNYSDFQDMLEEKRQTSPQPSQQPGPSDLAEKQEISWELQQPFGKWSNRLVPLKESLSLSISEWEAQETVNLTLDTDIPPTFGFSFCISGGFRTQLLGSKADVVTESGEAQVGFLQGESNSVSSVGAGQKVSLVQLQIAPHLLEALTQEEDVEPPKLLLGQFFDRTQAGFQWQTRTLTPAMRIALAQILQCPYRGVTKRIYLESKSLELIALQLHQLTEQPPLLSASVPLKSDDIERIYLARDILIRNLVQPPSLLALAKQSGINSFKLKQGFRQVFNTTVFGYLHAYRMEEARKQLLLGDWNVTQVAQNVGYANPSKFAAAFKKKFGISPKVLKSS